jgi:predicted DNA-binding transcriptional regulator YafY
MTKDHTPRTRIARLLALLYERRSITTSEAARYLGEADRNGRRRVSEDLQLLADHTDVDCIDEGRDRRYVLRSDLLPPKLGVTDRLALLIGRKHVTFLDDTLLRSPIDLEPAHGERIDKAIPTQRLRQLIHYIDEPARPYRDHDDVLGDVLDALFKHRTLTIEYRKPDGSPRTWLDTQPLSLVVYRRSLFVLVKEPSIEDPRLLAIDRIIRTRLGERFDYPEDWDPEAHFARTFGVHTTPTPAPVILRFSHHVAAYVRARTWHPSATLHELDNGGVELRMFVGGAELERFALEWGQHCEVVAPGWLRNKVRDALTAAAALYETTSTETSP